MKHYLIIGCGYIGLPLALLLKKQNQEVTGWVHSEETAQNLEKEHKLSLRVGDVGNPASWSQVTKKFDVVIHCASSGRGGESAYARVFREGWRQIVKNQTQAQMLFVSSTSVYAQKGGEKVTEDSIAEPLSATGIILREAEEIARQAGAIIVRSAGIYGPGRAVLLEKLRRGEAVMEGDGLRWINQIYQADLVAAILHVLDQGRTGAIYNVCDNEPVTYLEYYRWCCDVLQKPMPPFGPVNANRKRGLTNKQVLNTKLRALGWNPRYPGFREGLAGLL